ncbi:MAG: hypothetical protein H8E37_06860 [Planctomycetes bacterium]|nr:hypothetical protein [Planctomycetota bacterium]
MRIELVKSQDPVKLTPAGWTCLLMGCVLSVLIAYQYAVWDLKYGFESGLQEMQFEFLTGYPIIGIPVAIVWIGMGIRLFVIDYRWVAAKEGRYFGGRSRKALGFWALGLVVIVVSIWGS